MCYLKSFGFYKATIVILPPTCLKDLVSNGETCSVGLVVRHKLDEELISRGDYRGRGDLPTVLPHQLTTVVHTISHLHIVVPEQTTTAVSVTWCSVSLVLPQSVCS